jgi:hypothetical protein
MEIETGIIMKKAAKHSRRHPRKSICSDRAEVPRGIAKGVNFFSRSAAICKQ